MQPRTMNAAQISRLEGTFIYIFSCIIDDLSDLSFEDAVKALKTMVAPTPNINDVLEFMRKDMWKQIEYVRNILTHPAPQNSKCDYIPSCLGESYADQHTKLMDESIVKQIYNSTQRRFDGTYVDFMGSWYRACPGLLKDYIEFYHKNKKVDNVICRKPDNTFYVEQMGLLNLSSLNDKSALPITKEAIVSWVLEKLNEVLEKILRKHNQFSQDKFNEHVASIKSLHTKLEEAHKKTVAAQIDKGNEVDKEEDVVIAAPEVDNPAIKLFMGDGTSKNPSHLLFETWYHPDIILRLLNMSGNKSKCVPLVFPDDVYGDNTKTFKKQILQATMLSQALNLTVLAISKEPGAKNHFVCCLIKGDQILMINPLGITEQSALCETLAEMLAEDIISKVFLSSNRIQNREFEGALYSCGPIAIELAIHILSKLTKQAVDHFLSTTFAIKESTLEHNSGLVYHGLNINDLLPTSLTHIQSERRVASYRALIMQLRKEHGDYILDLTTKGAKSKQMKTEDYVVELDNSPAQSLFNTLITEDDAIVDIHKNPYFEALMRSLELDHPSSLSANSVTTKKITTKDMSNPVPVNETSFTQTLRHSGSPVLAANVVTNASMLLPASQHETSLTLKK